MNKPQRYSHLSHYGAFSGHWADDRLVIEPHPADPHPNAVIQNLSGALRHKARVARPMIRRGWLEDGPGKDARRDRDDFVEVGWDKALDLVATELKRVGDTHRMDGAALDGSITRKARSTAS